MEIFVDFGLFELLAALGVAWLGRRVFGYRLPGFLNLALSVVAPGALLFLVSARLEKMLSVVALATAVVNAGVLGSLMRRRDFPSLLQNQTTVSKVERP